MSAPTFRRLLLAGALISFALYAAWLFAPLLDDDAPAFARWGVLGTPLVIPAGDGWGSALGNPLLIIAVMLLSQWAFLRPLRAAAFVAGGAARPRWPAFVSVGLVATVLLTGFVATMLELAGVWTSGNDSSPGGVWGAHHGAVWMAMAGLWLGWSLVFLVYLGQGDFFGRAERLVRTLIRGSCLELLIAIPTHAWVYRRSTEDCYCMRGSYTGIVLGVTVLLWAFGPGLALMFWREKQRREPILQNRCPQCGAPLDATAAAGASCSECGRSTVR